VPRGPSQDEDPTVLGILLCVPQCPPSTISRQRPCPCKLWCKCLPQRLGVRRWKLKVCWSR